MKNSDKFSKDKFSNIIDALNNIVQTIDEIEELLDKEIVSDEVDLFYGQELNVNDINFNNMSFKQIKKVIEYLKQNSTFEEVLNLDNALYRVKKWCINRLLEDATFSKKPLSFTLSIKLDDLRFMLDDFNKEYYLIAKDFIVFDKNDLDKLKIKVIQDIHKFKLKIHEIDKKYKTLKADSDYIKRNKK